VLCRNRAGAHRGRGQRLTLPHTNGDQMGSVTYVQDPAPAEVIELWTGQATTSTNGLQLSVDKN
jgi:hypothetical protein